MIAQIYSDLKQNDKALEAFYTTKSKISNQSNSYINALFNIGLLESLIGNYEKAEPVFVELLQLDPTDFILIVTGKQIGRASCRERV